MSKVSAVPSLSVTVMTLPVMEDVPTATGAQAGLQHVKEAVLQDLMTFERGQPSPNAEPRRGADGSTRRLARTRTGSHASQRAEPVANCPDVRGWRLT